MIQILHCLGWKMSCRASVNLAKSYFCYIITSLYLGPMAPSKISSKNYCNLYFGHSIDAHKCTNSEKLFSTQTPLIGYLKHLPTLLMSFFLCECQIRPCGFSWAFGGGMYIQSHFKRVTIYQKLLLESIFRKKYTRIIGQT